ncbi:MAG TPA: phosphoenolpyruvate--protein phosphotransferase [Bacteroidota bacterium]|nr:phosphoenolpyruvate--protein phosphotransferase [Bacteroidota bacterium]
MPAAPDVKKKEVVLTGIAASPGIVCGSAYLYIKSTHAIEERKLDGAAEVEDELDRFEKALNKSAGELKKILAFAQQKVGDAKARILEAQIMVLDDPYLHEAIRKRIKKEKKNAEFVVDDEIGKYAKMMMAARDEYMHERAHDMDDLKNRIVRNLSEATLTSKFEGSHVVIAHNLTTADTMILSRNSVMAYATDLGGVTSHAALFSRSLKIPAVVALGDATREVQTGDTVILDGYGGRLVVNPGPATLREYEARRQYMAAFEERLTGLKDLPAVTTDGHTVELSANVELSDEMDYVVMQGSRGVGLYRTESLLIGRDDFPTEEEQYAEYKRISARIYPARVIMRTFDIGGDKIAPEMAEEANPFLGWRGIRVSLDRPDLFMTQLRAMLRASTKKNVAIMFPMVSTLRELLLAKDYVRKAKEELRAKKVRFDEKLPVGVMIEVPSAALNAPMLAQEADFLSIGSNDLIQYMLAVDRGNSLVSTLYEEYDPAVLTSIRHIINAGHKQKIWVGICGEMAGNPIAAPLLVGMGIDELSVVPQILPEIKKIIRSVSYASLQELARKALAMKSGEDVENLLRDFITTQVPDIPLEDSRPGQLPRVWP